ncbi:NB-ARC domain-containing protein [Mesorhizobium loti]|uniref:NB-ARC domain-containing protein n=1 Tax=Rhizobium loti TaxID=381 RepID=A0A8E2WCY8_RHILI|nr:SIR2 family protein [Mesorhizobium loti]PWJ91341.1 NB-ARC domain-containing protein [Mesorhizobium loti]
MTPASYDALVERLSDGILASRQPVTMVLGSAISAPTSSGAPGVFSAETIVDFIEREYFPGRHDEFREHIKSKANDYIGAFDFLIPRRGQNAANAVVRAAVWNSRLPSQMLESGSSYQPDEHTEDQAFLSFEADWDSWYLTPALSAIGSLASVFPETYGQTVLTTNFDPLIEIAIRRNRGRCFRNVFHRDGNIGQASGEGTNIVHLHGHWWGSDTLNTHIQLTQDRPRLKTSLNSLIRKDVILVCGYGGWDDVLNSALADIVNDDNAYPEILWALHGSDPSMVEDKLKPLVDRGRVTVYAGVDCNNLFPDVLSRLLKLSPRKIVAQSAPPSFVPPLRLQQEYDQRLPQEMEINRNFALLGPNEDDRPPNIDFYVGRQAQLEELVGGDYTVGYVTGIGGQGKSALAAAFFNDCVSTGRFEHCVWRDCKEEAERFEVQIVRITVALSEGELKPADLSHLSIEELFDVFLRYLSMQRILFIFDNVDHYMEMEQEKLSGSPADFLKKIERAGVGSKFLFTCRGNIRETGGSTLNIRLSGLDLESTIKLFSKRQALSTREDIEIAHGVTKGHALWLDLLAAQAAKHPEKPLERLLNAPSGDSAGIPLETLQSIWQDLKERERLVLRTLAECVRPSTEIELASFLQEQMNFNKIGKALYNLRSLNLIVVKSSGGFRDYIELHPIIREFIKRTFSRTERATFIDVIIRYYEQIFSVRVGRGKPKLTIEELQNWIEGIELHISAGKLELAFQLIAEVHRSGLYVLNCREFVRVCATLFSEISWDKYATYPEFDAIASAYSDVLSDLGRIDDARRLLAQYRETIVGKTVRYINYCDMLCYLEWAIGEYKEAIRWGEEGQGLKSKSNIDTTYDAGHNLALAKRDGGEVDAALAYFLKGRSIESALDPEDLDETLHESFYGNVGRCLQLMGQIDTALVCYRKSALLIERHETASSVNNRGYVRQWIGEVFAAKNADVDAAKFLKAALRIWAIISPVRESRLMSLVASRPEIAKNVAELDELYAERYCVAWFFGRETDV